MAFEEFSNYKQKISDTRGKFMMPLGWGWTYPFVKYTSMLLISIKTFTNIPWLPFFILSACIVRLLMAPLMIRQMVLIQRMAKVK
jgi:membrane protein insertase Oxa1/YidC/SpoIIIJ